MNWAAYDVTDKDDEVENTIQVAATKDDQRGKMPRLLNCCLAVLYVQLVGIACVVNVYMVKCPVPLRKDEKLFNNDGEAPEHPNSNDRSGICHSPEYMRWVV